MNSAKAVFKKKRIVKTQQVYLQSTALLFSEIKPAKTGRE
jgi:hypothetical protein